jgi:hypothetical protein
MHILKPAVSSNGAEIHDAGTYATTPVAYMVYLPDVWLQLYDA